MRLTIHFLGLELANIEITTDPAEYDDPARDLSGGELGSTLIEVGDSDRYMGFTNGREADAD